MEYNDIFNLISNYYFIDNGDHNGEYTPFIDERSKIEINIKEVLPHIISKSEQLVKEIELTFPQILAINHGSFAADTCYTIVLSVSQEEFERVSFTREFYCQFSMLANYFCLYGKDTIVLNDDGYSLYFDPIITISPKNLYEDFYSTSRSIVKEAFPNYTFLPYLFLQKRIAGLKIFTTFLKENQYTSVYQALFTPENITDYKLIGDILYK
ncbi:hypothetical protein KXD93_30465 [Mucilaginibacter sp. BJC16-A38]|uniref:hypothetical protein n=1 Tax=Mucilaginibacter phenanthrenivorans TaxID=1234842 RepID=UPI002158369E|nr:hypothetical protein [Mucilaginibacter phenanthrenivorans]MCR8562017.1 hypothetical protein [Mucilaginibacter phenanthrenivorans]